LTSCWLQSRKPVWVLRRPIESTGCSGCPDVACVRKSAISWHARPSGAASIRHSLRPPSRRVCTFRKIRAFRAAAAKTHALTHSFRQRAILQPQACASSASGAARDLRVLAIGEFNRSIAKSDRRVLARASGRRLHQRWALPFAYRQQRSLLSQFEFSAWQAQNQSCLARAQSGAHATLTSRCTTARWHHWHNAPELVLAFRMRLAIPAQEGDCSVSTTGLVDTRHIGSRD
jgi:hypothetical protein